MGEFTPGLIDDHPAVLWKKSSRSDYNADCAEVGSGDGGVLVRDSKDREGVVLGFGVEEWQAAMAAIKKTPLDALLQHGL